MVPLYFQIWVGGKLPLNCRLISSTVWKAVKPSAVLLTGDLVDGKNRNGGGRQSESEWQVPPPHGRCSTHLGLCYCQWTFWQEQPTLCCAECKRAACSSCVVDAAVLTALSPVGVGLQKRAGLHQGICGAGRSRHCGCAGQSRHLQCESQVRILTIPGIYGRKNFCTSFGSQVQLLGL